MKKLHKIALVSILLSVVATCGCIYYEYVTNIQPTEILTPEQRTNKLIDESK